VFAMILLCALRPPRGLDVRGGIRFHKPEQAPPEPEPSEEMALTS
jgi:hypothetical protein